MSKAFPKHCSHNHSIPFLFIIEQTEHLEKERMEIIVWILQGRYLKMNIQLECMMKHVQKYKGDLLIHL
jgi:hypothetical protein